MKPSWPRAISPGAEKYSEAPATSLFLDGSKSPSQIDRSSGIHSAVQKIRVYPCHPWFSFHVNLQQFLRGIRPNLAQRRMIERDLQKLTDGAAKVHCGDDFVDQFGRLRPDDGGSEDFTRFGVGDHLHKSFRLSHHHGLAVIVEWI